jgi:hypothetical protein
LILIGIFLTPEFILGIGWWWTQILHLSKESRMAKKSRLDKVAAKIGGALGKADRKAHQVVRAGTLAKKELQDITKQVDALKRQLAKTSKRLKHALS